MAAKKEPFKTRPYEEIAKECGLRETKKEPKILACPKEYSIVNPEAPLIEQSLKVRLPNGSINSINVFDYNLASLCHQADPKQWITVQLDDGSHIQVGSLKPIFKGES